MGNTLASDFFAEVGMKIFLVATWSVRANMTVKFPCWGWHERLFVCYRNCLYFFLGRWQTTLVGGPQSTQPSWHVYTCWFRVRAFPFFSGSHGNGTSPHHPINTCTHDIRYTCPGSSSGLMTFNWSDGVPWSRHQPWYIYCHFLPIESMITFGLQCQ